MMYDNIRKKENTYTEEKKMEELKNIYSYSKTEINKMKREDLLHLLYERDKNYYENVNGSEKNWSKENPFEKYKQWHKRYTVKELRERA